MTRRYIKNKRKFEENYINMEYLPLRIQSKIIRDIEHFSEKQCNVSTSCYDLEKQSLVNNKLFKRKTPGIISITSESRNSESDCSDDSAKVFVKKLSFEYTKTNNTIIEPPWITHAEEILKKSNTVESIRLINEKLQQIILDEYYLENWTIFNDLRRKLQLIAITVFEKDLKFCCENNLDSYFWKTLFYNVLQFLKYQRKNFESYGVQNLKKKSLQIVNDGLIYYKNFISNMERKFDFDSDLLLNGDHKNQYKISSLVKVTIQKIYLNLGDLHRYQAQLESNNYIEARKYYYNAQKLIPENGVPYNQLAITALSFNNYFEAVYYYIRSLTASNPIISAKESLKVLLDEIRKKYDEKFKIIHENVNTEAVGYDLENSVRHLRKEIWIHLNGSRRLRFQSETFGDSSFKKLGNNSSNTAVIKRNHFSNINNSINLDAMSNKELKKEFISSYLYVISKIFIGVNLETFENEMFQMLYEFRNAINRYPSILNRLQLLEITAINIFLYDYNRNKIANDEDSETNRKIRNYAFTVGLLMFSIIINRANDVLEQFTIELNERNDLNFESVKRYTEKAVKNKCVQTNKIIDETSKSELKNPTFSTKSDLKLMENLPSEFAELLQPIKIWCNWLNLNLQLCKLSLCNFYQQITPWKNFATLLTTLSRIFKNLVNNLSTEPKLLHFEENIYLLGFSPLKAMLTKTVSEKSNKSDKYSEILYRIQEILNFAINNLCCDDLSILNVKKIANGNLIFTKNLTTFEQHQNVSSSKNLCPNTSNDSDDYEDFKFIQPENNSVNLNIDKNDEANISEFNKLKKKKIMLEKSNKAQELYKEKLKNILEDVGNVTIMEVKPKYLVPDTNCFIDFLDELEYLVTMYNSYLLMVPLVVINELEGLTKGFKMDPTHYQMSWKMANSRIHHFDEVARISERSLNFIKDKARLNIRCCTTRGSILKNSSTFTLEENDDNIYSNDDKILTSALSIATENYVKEEAEKSYIRTEVVLLTTDRNLKVKALAKNLAVSGLKEFLNWTEEKETCFD